MVVRHADTYPSGATFVPRQIVRYTPKPTNKLTTAARIKDLTTMGITRAPTLVIVGVFFAAALQVGSTFGPPEVVIQDGPRGIWQPIGPLPILSAGQRNPARYNSGRVISIAANPSNANHWIAGAATGGIWTTLNAGETWTTNTDGLPSLAIGAIAFAPSNPAIVFAGTGEANFSRDARAGVGILKSTDGGTTWTLLASSALSRTAFAAIRINPANPDVILAATSRGAGNGLFSEIVLGATPLFGVLRSIDGGGTWTRTLTGQAGAIEIDARNFGNQFAAIGDVNVGQTNDSPGSQPNGLYRSSDAGMTWSSIEGPWTIHRPGKIVPALAPSNPNVLYVSVSGLRADGAAAQTVLGLYRTDDAWSAAPSWRRISTDATGPQGYCSIQCSSAHVLTVDPSDHNTLFAGGRDELWRCSNCDSSPIWTNADNALHPDHRALSWAGNRLLDGNDGGVGSTVDRGATWQVHNATLSITQIFSGALHPTNPRMVLAGTKDNGCLVWVEGTAWRGMGVPQHGVCEGDVAISNSRPDSDWMTAANFGEVNRTQDGGRSFRLVARGIGEPVAPFTAAVRKCPANDDVFLTGNTRLWRTNDFFSSLDPTWAANGPPDAGDVRAIAFAASDRDCNTYAFGTKGFNNDGRIWLTTNGGNSWTNITSANPVARTVSSLAFEQGNPNILYAAYGNFDAGGRNGHAFKTTNALAPTPIWTNVSPAENSPANVVMVDPANPSVIYLGSDLGVWRSIDGAATWSHLGPEVGMPNGPVHDLKVHPVTREVFAFTFGRGVFMLAPAQ